MKYLFHISVAHLFSKDNKHCLIFSPSSTKSATQKHNTTSTVPQYADTIRSSAP